MAKRKTGEEPDVIYRTEKFEVRPDEQQLEVLLKVSENLREVWNDALAHRLTTFAEHIAPIYERLKSAATSGENTTQIRKDLKAAYKQHSITLFDQINTLTPKREASEIFAAVPRNWQEETLDRVNGSYSSFLALRKNGDYDARTPHEVPEGRFMVIRGRSSFKIEDGQIELRCPKVSGDIPLTFLIPEHQQKRLARATRIKQFVLSRDMQDLGKPGRFWISINYEIPKPEQVEFDIKSLVFVAPTADYVGIVSPRGELVQKLWRPDRHWLPEIENVEARMKECVKHSRKWHRLNQARRAMQVRMARQQLQDQREVVTAELLKKHGKHFVVLDLVIRSKAGKLADGDKPERGGKLGLNWSAQNTGSLGRLILQLEDKVREFGGSVRKYRLPLDENFPYVSKRDAIRLAQRIRESFLESLSVGTAS